MARIRDWFRRSRANQKTETLSVTGSAGTFSRFSGDPYANDVYRAGVDAIARIAGKMRLQPIVRFSDGTTADADDRLARLLQIEPNPLMTAYDMIYMLVTHLYTNNNAYCYVYRDDMGSIRGFYPLHVSYCEYRDDPSGTIYCKFTFNNGSTTVFPYSDVIHLRRHFNSSDVDGDANDAIAAGIELANTQNEGIVNGIRESANIRGILHYTKILSPENLKKYRDDFVEQYMGLQNSGGVAALDNSAEYIPLSKSSAVISAEDQKAVKTKIYDYLGISESIVNSTFTDDDFSAFDESVLEGLALQFGLEFTRKVYTPLQRARGHEINCGTSRIAYMSNSVKASILHEVVPAGLVSINEAREMLGLSAIEGGDKYIQSLNYVDASIADKYQLYRAGNGQVHSMNAVEAATTDMNEEGSEDDQGV